MRKHFKRYSSENSWKYNKPKKIKYYHGTDKQITELSTGSFITKSFKEACKFGYRKAVLNKSQWVFIYSISCDAEKKTDENRNRAFVLLEKVGVELYSIYDTYSTPFKLKNFKFPSNRKP